MKIEIKITAQCINPSDSPGTDHAFFCEGALETSFDLALRRSGYLVMNAARPSFSPECGRRKN
jgi:hypothetical protein